MPGKLMEYFNKQPRLGVISTSGPKLETYKSQMAKIVGEQAAEMIAVLAIFEVTEVRPLIDFGQGCDVGDPIQVTGS
ncbi:MAG: hypothetical protein LUO89_14295 [Methanothrix sp.]|nr:hypothetical protein [Methanothrix sp.]